VLANRSNHLPDLPTSFRGYDREKIDQYLEQVEAGYLGLAAERDDFREQVEDLTRQLKRYRKREDSVTEQLARAEQVAAGMKVQAQKEIEEQRAELADDRRALEIEQAKVLRQNELLKTTAQEEADTLLANARAKADALVTNARLEADSVVTNATAEAERKTYELTARANAEREAAARVLDDTRARLAAMVTDLIKQLPVGTAGTPGARPPQ
jgi:cell division septum initiation protein DivIVA